MLEMVYRFVLSHDSRAGDVPLSAIVLLGDAASMPTRNVVLTEQQAAMIEHLVHSGRYQNASEVPRDGLRLLQQREAENDASLEALRCAAKAGLEDFAAGRYRAFSDGAALRDDLTMRVERMLGRSPG